jgi:hypothetical protein
MAGRPVTRLTVPKPHSADHATGRATGRPLLAGGTATHLPQLL